MQELVTKQLKTLADESASRLDMAIAEVTPHSV